MNVSAQKYKVFFNNVLVLIEESINVTEVNSEFLLYYPIQIFSAKK